MINIQKESILNQTSKLVDFCQKSLDNSKALDIVSINVAGHSSITDEMIICTGSSNRHVGAIADRLVDHLAQYGVHGVSISGKNEGLWVLVDVGNVIVHIMQQEARERYGLEDLYKCVVAGAN